uniref:F-box domain-containing protein n=1 Tax=Mycena chlorophos TaxID=658473 RepID=A0ABQ0LMZ7_MYCCL|nr:predicted protein [Mycena chlorophos]
MSALPFDLLVEIVNFVDLQSLPALALADKNMLALALDYLYTSIPPERFLAASVSILGNASLAARVRTLEVNRKEHQTSYARVVPVLTDVLAATNNLRHLNLSLEGTYSEVIFGRTKCQLRTLSCNAFTSKRLIQFLEQQSSLEELNLTHSLLPTNHSWNFPRLRRFSGPMTWIDSVLPFAPTLSHLVITSTRRSDRQELEVLAQSLITHLEVPFSAVQMARAVEMGRVLPYLQSFVISMQRDWRGLLPDPPDNVEQTLKHWLLDVLPVLSSLRRVTILGYEESETPEGAVDFIREVTARVPPLLSEFSIRPAIQFSQELRVWRREHDEWKQVTAAQ